MKTATRRAADVPPTLRPLARTLALEARARVRRLGRVAQLAGRSAALLALSACDTENVGALSIESVAYSQSALGAAPRAGGAPSEGAATWGQSALPILTCGSTIDCTTGFVAAGAYHTIALKLDGTAWAWGYNMAGQLGDGTTMSRATPSQVEASGGSILTNVTSIAAGLEHSVASLANGSVFAWGGNTYGQLGDNTTVSKTSPVQVALAGGGYLMSVVAVSARGSHTVALRADGTVWAWGYNGEGELGDATTIDRHAAAQVKLAGGGFLSGVKAIAAGESHSVALKSDGTVFAWGSNVYGQLGDGTESQRTTPVQVALAGGGFLSGIVAIAAGNDHSVALASDGAVYSWGYGYEGQLGNNTMTKASAPTQALAPGGGALSGAVAIAAGGEHTIAILNDGSARTWGYNGYGQLGDNTTVNALLPAQVTLAGGGGLSGVVSIAGGAHHTVVMKADGALQSFGYNTQGQLGDNTLVDRHQPVDVLGLSLANPCQSGMPTCDGGLCGAPTKPNGAPCTDSDACTQSDTCQAGVCVGASPVVCGAPDACHDPGTCSAVTGACSIPPKADGAPCNDGDLCTLVDACHSGACVGASPVVCAAQDQCHAPGACDPATGACSSPIQPDGSACNDLNACTQSDTCQAGACVGASPKVCAAPSECSDAVCDPANGLCVTVPKSDGAPCSDGDQCTPFDACEGGACKGSGSVACPAADACHDAGSCSPATGLCLYPIKADGSGCDDGDPCTVGDQCAAGACKGAAFECPAPDQCHNQGVCKAIGGAPSCTAPPRPDGALCDADNNGCTLSDKCQGGVCVPGPEKTCFSSTKCHIDGVCNPATGECSDPKEADGAACDDENPCTIADKCKNGLCNDGTPLVCPDIDACHTGACEKTTGECFIVELKNCSLPDAGPPPPPPPSDYQTCVSPEECASGFCVDGVCCDAACTEKCHTCVQPGAIGKCLPTPLGSDLRHECGEPGECSQTCGGPENPDCIDAIAGTECLPSVCLPDGVHGLDRALCPAPGAACPVNERTAFDCTPYRCVKVTGACDDSCASIDDCAPPFVCDPTFHCVSPPPVASSQTIGCALGASEAPSDFGSLSLLAAAAALGLARRRRPPAPTGKS